MNFEDFKENFSSDVKDTLERRNGIEYEVDARTVEKMNSTYEALMSPEEYELVLNLQDKEVELHNEYSDDFNRVFIFKSADGYEDFGPFIY